MNLLLNSNNAEEEILPAGSVIFKQGERADFAYVIRRGKVSTVVKNEKRIYPIGIIESDGITGEDAVFSHSIYKYSAVVLEQVTLVKIPAKDIQQYLSDSPDWMAILFKELATKVQNTIEIISQNKIQDDTLFGGNDFSEKDERLISKAIS